MENQPVSHTSRTRLPSTSTKNDSSIWSVLKNCVGKDLSKIAMPVQFNEPLSFLQRVSEYMEYSNLLNKIDINSNPISRMESVSAFAVSALSSNLNRLGKPFNPLQGETYELVNENYRFISEQISHHPPISAFHAESKDFIFQGWIYPKLKLWGKSVEIHPKGIMKLHLKKFNENYSWANINCTVHLNVNFSKMKMEHNGTMEICSDSSLKATIHFKPAGWFSNELHRIEGFITDTNKKTKCRYLYGKWNEYIKSTDIESYEEYMKANDHKFKLGADSADPNKKSPSTSPSPSKKMFQKFNSLSIRNFSVEATEELSPENQEESLSKGETGSETVPAAVIDIPNSEILWEVTPKPDYADQYYYFTLFAMSLNEIHENQLLCLTDSRFRPDIRKLEEGNLEGASEEKNRLEEKQRKLLKKGEIPPRWFSKSGGENDWVFNNTLNYWNTSKNNIPSIF